MSEIKKNALGRGLSSLLAPREEEKNDEIFSLPLTAIEKGAFQPRKFFAEEDLHELAASIKERGILQPILVRRLEENRYEIIAGERRSRAAKIAGLSVVPAIVREFSDKEALEIALLENIQRQDLNPIEEAQAYHRLAEEFGHTQETLSRILGKSRSHIANTLRLLTLPSSVQEHLVTGKLSAGHGRALIGLENPEAVADTIISRRLSVRQAEALAKKKETSPPLKEAPSFSFTSSADKDLLQGQLAELIGWPVILTVEKGKGTITLSFKNPTELDHLMNTFNQMKRKGF